jgi:hypothetical protein
MLKKVLIIIFGLFSFQLFFSCGDKFDFSQFPLDEDSSTVYGDTSFVAVNPDWTGFNKPQDIIVGNEPLIYVANTGDNEIICLDFSGKEIGRSVKVMNPVAIAQDYKLNLIICGEFDTTINNETITYGAIYKMNLYEVQNDISQAKIQRVYFDKSNPNRRFTGVAVLSTNKYYITRDGPNNTSLLDPDNAVLLFTEDNEILTPISNLKPNGTGLESISGLSSISIVKSKSSDFIFTQTGSTNLFKVQWITLIQGTESSYYTSKYTSSNDGDLSILQINRFDQPEDVTVDASGNIFVVDAAKDSVIRFTSKGMEKYSFGGHGSGQGKFNEPYGVAFYNKTLYIADTGNDRIVRFMLSTDIE